MKGFFELWKLLICSAAALTCHVCPCLGALTPQGPIKGVALAGPYLASGGSDDLVHIYDIKVGGGQGGREKHGHAFTWWQPSET